MNRRELTLVSLSLAVGLLVGMMLVGSSDDLRESLFGTAGSDKKDTPKDELVYYQVQLPDANEWLTGQFPDTSDDLGAAVDVIGKLTTSTDFRTDFKNAKESVDTVLPQAFAALVGAESNADVQVNKDLSVCLGFEDDPYSLDGPIMYLYLTVPTGKVKDFSIPEEWQELDGPRTNDLYWQLLACFPEAGEAK